MTTVTSNEALARSQGKPPIALLFKAKTARRTNALVKHIGPSLNLSLQWAEKSSYRKAELLEFLERWLDPWTPQREKDSDYRILNLDVARSHVGSDVEDFAFSRGYITVYHYGGTTGVAQVNDTDCHGGFESTFLEHEQDAFNQRQMMDPGNISRSPVDVLQDVMATWRSIDHMEGVKGHKRTGLSNALDGSEDDQICREALECWNELDMNNLRKEALAKVDELIRDKGLQMSDWRQLIVHDEDPGVQEEGEEFEGENMPGEVPWEAEGAQHSGEEETAAVLAALAPQDPVGKSGIILVYGKRFESQVWAGC